MANFYYRSEHLDRVLYLADIESLSAHNLRVLQLELEEAVGDIKEQVNQQGDFVDPDKLHSMSLKINVCQKFLSRVQQMQVDGSSKVNTYHLAYFRQAVSNLIGPLQADQVFEKAKQDALRQLAKESNS